MRSSPSAGDPAGSSLGRDGSRLESVALDVGSGQKIALATGSGSGSGGVGGGGGGGAVIVWLGARSPSDPQSQNWRTRRCPIRTARWYDTPGVECRDRGSSVRLTCRSNPGWSPYGGNAHDSVRSIQDLPVLRRAGGAQAGRLSAPGVRYRDELEVPLMRSWMIHTSL